MRNIGWPSIAYRVFAVLNLIFAVVGLLFLLPDVWTVYNGALGNGPEAPYFLQAFWTMMVANICFLGLLAFGGVYLWRLNSLGVTICNITFVTEIVYFPSLGLLWAPPIPKAISMSIAAATGVANVGISTHIFCGYPLIALICLNLARRRLGRSDKPLAAVPEIG